MPKVNEQDLIWVRNISMDDDTTVSDIVRVPHTVYDENNKPIYAEYDEREEEWDNSKGFRVKWNGRSHVIKPGERKVMPRFLAEHYAKHLADHMMMRGGFNDANEKQRKAFKHQIMESVYQFYEVEDFMDEGAEVLADVNRLNRIKEPGEVDLGKFDEEHVVNVDTEANPYAKAPVREDVVPAKKRGETVGSPDAEPTRNELLHEAKTQGHEVTGKETADELKEMLTGIAS